MRIRKNGKVVRLTESDLMRITRKVLREQKGPEANIDSLGIQQDSNTREDIADAIDDGAFKTLTKNGMIRLGSDGKGSYFQVLKRLKSSASGANELTSMLIGSGNDVRTLNNMLKKATLGTKYYYRGSGGDMNEHRRYW
jgi:hypothetical protein